MDTFRDFAQVTDWIVQIMRSWGNGHLTDMEILADWLVENNHDLAPLIEHYLGRTTNPVILKEAKEKYKPTGIQTTKIGYRINRDKGSCVAHVMQTHNHLNQKCQLAFDGFRWFYSRRGYFDLTSPGVIAEKDLLRMFYFMVTKNIPS